MATGDYNSPYTGQQLDDTIRKISSNNIHTYVKVYDNAAGAEIVSINSLPAGPNGLRTGVYDILYSNSPSTRSTSIMDVVDLSQHCSGSGRSNAVAGGTGVLLKLSQTIFLVADQSFHAIQDSVDVGANTVTADAPMKIYEIYRQDTIA